MQVVPAVSTPISAEHARDALLAAMPGIDRDSASLLLALIWIETGRGNLMNWNAGNITAGASWPGNAWRPPWFAPSDDPHLADLHERMLKGTAPSAFRAYDSAPEGFGDFVRALKHQFQSVLDAASSGDPGRFVAALHDSGYSRDYTPAHIPGFHALREQFLPLLSHLPAGGGVATAGAGGLALLALIWIGSRYLRKHHHGRKHHR